MSAEGSTNFETAKSKIAVSASKSSRKIAKSHFLSNKKIMGQKGSRMRRKDKSQQYYARSQMMNQPYATSQYSGYGAGAGYGGQTAYTTSMGGPTGVAGGTGAAGYGMPAYGEPYYSRGGPGVGREYGYARPASTSYPSRGYGPTTYTRGSTEAPVTYLSDVEPTGYYPSGGYEEEYYETPSMFVEPIAGQIPTSELRKPSAFRGRMNQFRGGLTSGMGKMVRNEGMVARGESLRGSGQMQTATAKAMKAPAGMSSARMESASAPSSVVPISTSTVKPAAATTSRQAVSESYPGTSNAPVVIESARSAPEFLSEQMQSGEQPIEIVTEEVTVARGYVSGGQTASM
jgi:hypothetical protein